MLHGFSLQSFLTIFYASTALSSAQHTDSETDSITMGLPLKSWKIKAGYVSFEIVTVKHSLAISCNDYRLVFVRLKMREVKVSFEARILSSCALQHQSPLFTTLQKGITFIYLHPYGYGWIYSVREGLKQSFQSDSAWDYNKVLSTPKELRFS